MDRDDEEALARIGALRRRAYAAVGKADPSGPPMLDRLDRADHVVHLAWEDADGAIVAAVRLLLPRTTLDAFDLDDEVDLAGLLPDRRWIGEASRLVVDPDRPAPRALLALTTAVAYELVRRGRAWVLLCADPRLTPFYLSLGCRDLGKDFRHAALGGCPHQVVLGCVRAAAQGRLVASTGIWSVVFAPAAGRLLDERARLGLRAPEAAWLRLRCAAARSVRSAWLWQRSRGRRPRPSSSDVTGGAAR